MIDSAAVSKAFPIPTQTSENDKRVLLKSIALMGADRPGYRYLEIGSFLGGSLTPFLNDAACASALSIDERERAQPDERGVNYDYAGITHDTMREKLHEADVATDKLQTFDGSVHQYVAQDGEKYDLAFIDGEHTDVACFRDFIWTHSLMAPDSVVLFHDSTLVFRALQLIIVHLEKLDVPFRFIKVSESEMTACLFGIYATDAFAAEFGPLDDADAFFEVAEGKRILSQIRHRVRWRFSASRLTKLKFPLSKTVLPPKTEKAF